LRGGATWPQAQGPGRGRFASSSNASRIAASQPCEIDETRPRIPASPTWRQIPNISRVSAVMRRAIIDTGSLVAFLGRAEQHQRGCQQDSYPRHEGGIERSPQIVRWQEYRGSAHPRPCRRAHIQSVHRHANSRRDPIKLMRKDIQDAPTRKTLSPDLRNGSRPNKSRL
jgi:hypothetical protein